VRVCASKNRMPVRTLDDGTPLRPPRPVLPDDARSMLDAALDNISGRTSPVLHVCSGTPTYTAVGDLTISIALMSEG